MRGISEIIGPRGWRWIAAGILAAYLVVGLTPFRPNIPRRVENAAVRTARQTIAFRTPGISRTWQAPPWLDAAVEHNAFRVKLRVRSFCDRQGGPARILTVSKDPLQRNLTIAQEGAELLVRLRTPATSHNGVPAYQVGPIFTDARWRDIEVRVDSAVLTVSVDGRVALRRPLPQKSLRDWDRKFPLALGNELTLDRPWLGEVAQATVEAGSQTWDCLAMVEAPPYWWRGLKFQWLTPEPSRWRDLALNFLCFIPFGFAVAMMGGRRRGVLLAVGACALCSLAVEFTQLFVESRMPSASDWMTNALGGAVGAVSSRTWRPGDRSLRLDAAESHPVAP